MCKFFCLADLGREDASCLGCAPVRRVCVCVYVSVCKCCTVLLPQARVCCFSCKAVAKLRRAKVWVLSLCFLMGCCFCSLFAVDVPLETLAHFKHRSGGQVYAGHLGLFPSNRAFCAKQLFEIIFQIGAAEVFVRQALSVQCQAFVHVLCLSALYWAKGPQFFLSRRAWAPVCLRSVKHRKSYGFCAIRKDRNRMQHTKTRNTVSGTRPDKLRAGK